MPVIYGVSDETVREILTTVQHDRSLRRVAQSGPSVQRGAGLSCRPGFGRRRNRGRRGAGPRPAPADLVICRCSSAARLPTFPQFGRGGEGARRSADSTPCPSDLACQHRHCSRRSISRYASSRDRARRLEKHAEFDLRTAVHDDGHALRARLLRRLFVDDESSSGAFFSTPFRRHRQRVAIARALANDPRFVLRRGPHSDRGDPRRRASPRLTQRSIHIIDGRVAT